MTTNKRYKTIQERRLAYQTALLALKSDVTANYNDTVLITKAIAETLDIVQTTQGQDKQLYCWSEKDQLYVELETFLDTLVADAIVTLMLKKPLSTVYADVRRFLYTDSLILNDAIQQMNQPPRYVIWFKNGVFNVKTGKMVAKKDAAYYHFTQRRQLNFSNKVTNLDHKNIITRVLMDWSKDDEEVKLLLLQYLRAVVEGNNRGRGLIIQGGGGNGKSTFINAAERLVGMDAVLRVNIHQMENSFNLQGLSSKTALIAGDELRSSYHFGGESLSTCKMILDNQGFMLNLKGQQPKMIFPQACLIQATNTPLRFSEANDAIRDRFLYIEWSTKNYRHAARSDTSSFDLKRMLDDPSFIESLLAYVYEYTEDFVHFTIPKTVQQSTEKQLKQSDTIARFVDYLEIEGLLQHNSLLTAGVLYYLYTKWLKDESPGATVMARNQFFARLEPRLEIQGWTKLIKENKTVQIRASKVSFKEMNFVQLAALTNVPVEARFDNHPLYKRSIAFVNTKQTFQKEHNKDVLIQCKNEQMVASDKLTMEQKRALVVACFDDQDLILRGLLADRKSVV